MALTPVVRYMILCDGWSPGPGGPSRPTITGLISSIESTGSPPYPLVRNELCVFLALTDSFGPAPAKIVCVFDETGLVVFETPTRVVPASTLPLEVVSVAIRVRDCRFPYPGLYLVQFWYDGDVIAECPLRMR